MPITLNLENHASDPPTRRALAGLSLAVAKCKKIVVLTGAGISCSCGIPDFRSSDGLYALVKSHHPDVVLKGRDLFDAALFRDPASTALFYAFIAGLKRAVDGAQPGATHRFLGMLEGRRKLVRVYTQNVDGLEERAGLINGAVNGTGAASKTGAGKGKARMKDTRNVQLHGDIHRVRCTFCAAEFACAEEHLRVFESGTAPDCPECVSRSEARTARSARALRIGTLRPAIVLYDEAHPRGDDIGAMQGADMKRRPDMLVVMGTSLKVHGFKRLVREFARVVHESSPTTTPGASSSSGSTDAATASPAKTPNAKTLKNWTGKVIYVNKTPPGAEWDGVFDYWVQGESDAWVGKVEEDWRRMRPGDWEVQGTLDAALKVQKDSANAKPKGEFFFCVCGGKS
ncbi:DHS-like NAD/FAD-binding domain-containing protein [Trametopsis cervina]|nr:DHS-like NAD/FAD-binding domain-containing protein [Trametopsis cervina]